MPKATWLSCASCTHEWGLSCQPCPCFTVGPRPGGRDGSLPNEQRSHCNDWDISNQEFDWVRVDGGHREGCRDRVVPRVNCNCNRLHGAGVSRTLTSRDAVVTTPRRRRTQPETKAAKHSLCWKSHCVDVFPTSPWMPPEDNAHESSTT